MNSKEIDHILFPLNSKNFLEYFFQLSSETKELLLSLKPNFGHNGFGELVYFRTYSRLKENGERERWNDTVIRVVEGTMSILKNHMITNYLEWNDDEWQSYARKFALSMFRMEFLPPGRGLWAMGTNHVIEHGSMALNNCAFCDTSDLLKATVWTTNALMCGCGVGFNTAWEGALYCPTTTFKFKVPDSRKGWAQSVGLLVSAFTKPETPLPIFNYKKIRPAGQELKGFGGTASGPGPLITLHQRIKAYLRCRFRVQKGMSPNNSIIEMIRELANVEHGYNDDLIKRVRAIPNKTYGYSRLIVDIFNAIGSCVVSGNIRRSSEIAIGEAYDKEFLRLKDYEHNPERTTVMWLSNNTTCLKTQNEFKSGIPKIARQLIQTGSGEPGISNLRNIQEWGRVGKKVDHDEPPTREQEPDKAIGQNPCGEICLESFELCCLSEVFPVRCFDPEDEDQQFDRKIFYQACEHATFYATIVSLLPTDSIDSNRVIKRNHRIGVSLSGTAIISENLGYTELVSLLREAYNVIRLENKSIADLAGIPASIRVTTIKPSGTISQLVGVPPGIHYPPENRYVVRRIRISKTSKIHRFLTESGMPYEDDVTNPDYTAVYSFPLDQGHTRSVKEVGIWEQLEVAKLFQRFYSDNSVSVTVSYTKEEESILEQAITTSIPYLKSLSFLLLSTTFYQQAPYESITEEQYRELVSKIPQLNWSRYIQLERTDCALPRFCDGDKCLLGE